MWRKISFLAVWLAVAWAQTQELSAEFSPVVSATCKTGHMSIKIHFTQPFNGIAHAREYRSAACSALGNGSDTLAFDINLMAPVGSQDYCGYIVSNKTDERSVPLAVRVHRTLELADDKFYVITCGKAGGLRNSRNETSLVSLKVINENGRRVTNTVFGLPYTLRADFSKPDGMTGIRVKNCVAFNMRNESVKLIDSRGCPEQSSVSAAKYDQSNGQADITIASMFRFIDSSQVNFQCDVSMCKGVDVAGNCPAPDCASDGAPDPTVSDEATVTASTGVFVFDPNDKSVIAGSCAEGGVHPQWLLYLAIALGVMFLIMLLINCFLCTAMTCSCARTEVIEKDPSVSGDYDPYRSWHGSQYGSRYPSSTIHSARSGSDSDHYAIVTSRPGSRHSGVHRSRH